MKTNKKYLASANTSVGFVNCFENINTLKNSFCYILKGGPGTGKSSLMKKIAFYFEQKGIDIEYFYCSSDADSLDGIRIKNFSVVDGTAPHITEASMPGIKEKIVNVGAFIKEDIKINKAEIQKLMLKKSQCFKLAYKYFSMLKTLVDIQLIKNNSKDICQNRLTKSKKSRTLFASYISPSGFKSFYKQNSYKNVVVLNGNFIEQQKPLKEIECKLKKQNSIYTKFLSVFEPSFAEAILDQETNTLYVCSDAYEQTPKFKNLGLATYLTNKVSKLLSKAKYYHKKIESFYIACMDFKKLNKVTENIIKEIDNSL